MIAEKIFDHFLKKFLNLISTLSLAVPFEMRRKKTFKIYRSLHRYCSFATYSLQTLKFKNLEFLRNSEQFLNYKRKDCEVENFKNQSIKIMNEGFF